MLYYIINIVLHYCVVSDIQTHLGVSNDCESFKNLGQMTWTSKHIKHQWFVTGMNTSSNVYA